MEPLVGRLLTPHFGGAAHVWLICLMFFQAMLFFGYLYAHILARTAGAWHLLILLAPFVSLPLDIKPQTGIEAPVSQLLTVLILHAGLPFVVLSTTAVVAQVWLTTSSLGKLRNPYPLYGASNAGSFAALFGYSFLAEPLMGLRIQSLSWTALYLVYVALACASWYLLFRERKKGSREPEVEVRTAAVSGQHAHYVRWIILSCLPSALLLAVTNLIILEIGSFPLTWIFPLALYLLSFIVTFKERGGVPSYLRRLWPEILLVAAMLYLFGQAHWFNSIVTLITFFLICLVGHGTLYNMRPPAGHLTHFYLAIAFGGWLGGAAVSLAAPLMFNGLYEYPLLLVLLGGVFFLFRQGAIRDFIPDFKLFGMLRILLIVLVLTQVGRAIYYQPDVKFHHRNFYGTYRVADLKGTQSYPVALRMLLHGSTLHGAQWLEGTARANPAAYYYRGGAIAQAFAVKSSPRNIAVIGLGAGASAAYASEHDIITFYEIDPDIEPIARNWFTYLDDCAAEKKIIVGDGRLALQQKQGRNKKYDLILIDAFSGDGIPVHLLTREALHIYLARLSPNGLLIFHISNRYYELRPVIKAIAQQFNLSGAINVAQAKEQLGAGEINTRCVVLSTTREPLNPLINTGGWVGLDEFVAKEMAPWTDDHINILEPLWEQLRTSCRTMRITLSF
jgi:hypothetical protein